MKRTIAAITILFIFASVGAATNKEVKLPVSINKDGTLNRPPHYLQWVNVGTTLLPKGTVNIIDNLPIPNDEYIDTYVEPQSFAI
ncbi:cytochrome P460 [Roseibium sp. TrichSKD4]|uniref:cytochrome P460 n=1 Tax=Roseibium sp. TrichSKD4 TaxID=744980 RepID=UPI0001E56E17|nr:cytochrome P460 [Roseibium sp. TrichSKD4]EFO31554.1 cytochrome P460 [Roseibium sp. TrichSKD4]